MSLVRCKRPAGPLEKSDMPDMAVGNRVIVRAWYDQSGQLFEEYTYSDRGSEWYRLEPESDE